MENTELNDVVTTETVEEIAEALPTGNSGVKQTTIIGAAMVAGAALWELGVKPLGKKTITWIANKKAAKKAKTAADNSEETESEESDE